MFPSRRFTLQSGRWYAAEFIADGFGPPDFRSRSPIRVHGLRPLSRGARRFELSFFHANYPEGVQEKTYVIQTIERREGFILARRVEEPSVMLVMLFDISWEWLRIHFGMERPSGAGEVEQWLSARYRCQGDDSDV